MRERTSAAYLARVTALALVYAAAARLGLALDAVSGYATLVWPPSGIALAALILWGRAAWPGIAIGAALANVLNGAPIPVALGIAAGNTLEALLGAWVLERLGFAAPLERLRDVLGLTAVALAAPLLAATIGVASLHVAGIVPADHAALTWRAWWLGDTTGILVFAPPLLTFGVRRLSTLGWRGRRVAEGVLFTGCASLGWLLTPSGLGPSGATALLQAYLILPLVLWAALRFDLRGVTASTLFLASIAVAETALGRGPFVHGSSLAASLTQLQLFLGIVAVTALLLAAAVAERREARAAVARDHELTARLYEQARDAIRVRDEFLSIASHELRTPLGALVLELALLKRQLRAGPGADGGAVATRAERAARSAARLTRLVDALLDVSRIQTGRFELEVEDCDLAEMAREVIERLATEARRAGCEVRLCVEGAAGGRWDRLRVEQVLENLLSNAFKYGAGKLVDVSVAREGGVARVSVLDGGVGISAVDADRIFGRYERAASTSNYGGLGLGLYIARQIVEAHAGAIRVTSEPGKGARFTVELPLDASAGSARGAASAAPARDPDAEPPSRPGGDGALPREGGVA